MMKCIAIDDEPLALEVVKTFCAKRSDLNLLAVYTNPLEAFTQIEILQPELIFLDVQMQELTGLQFLKLLNGRCKVVLTTAYPDFALEGFELDVIDYLLKPFSFDRFSKSIEKVKNYNREVEVLKPNSEVDFIFVKADQKIVKIFIDDILYIEGLKDYISIFTRTERIVTLQNMKKMEALLPSNLFVRVHKSYIVSLNKIDAIERGRVLINKVIIPIGETYKEHFYELVGI